MSRRDKRRGFAFGRPRLRPGQSAFTLLELLVVIAIVVVLMSLVVPSVSSLLNSNNLTRGGQILSDQINLARQIASARNVPVEVRVFKLSGASPDGYSAVQLWTLNANGKMAASTRLAALPQSIVISENTTLSGALAAMPVATMPADAAMNANAPYASFRILPSGVVTPVVDMKACYLTILLARFAKNGALPANYVTIQINPLTATPLIYRP